MESVRGRERKREEKTKKTGRKIKTRGKIERTEKTERAKGQRFKHTDIPYVYRNQQKLDKN